MLESTIARPRTAFAAMAAVILIAGVAATPALGNVSPGPERAMSFGIVPQQSASRLAKVWIPFLNHVAEKSGYRINFATARDIPTFEACLAKGAYDLSYMNPYHYTVFHDVAGYRAFARQSNKKLKGLIVVRKSANITRLEDLGGSDLAFPSPAAFGASVIPRAELRSRGVAFTPQYVRSHDSVYRAVSSGLVAAGGGVLRTFNTVPANIRDQLKIIYRTSGYTPHAFAAHPDVSEETLATISKIMRETATLAPGHLKTLGMKGIEAAQNADWDDVRSLKLKKSQTNVIAEGGGQCLSG